MALDHKEQVQGHIHHAGNAQIQQRPLCVPGGTEDTIAEVVYRHGRHTQSVDPQIPHGAGQQLLLGIQQQQHGLRQQQTDQTHHDTDTAADEQGGVDGLLHVLVTAQPQSTGHDHVDTAADANEQPRKQGYQQSGGAHSAQRQIVGKFTGNGHVAEVEQHLQHLRHHQGQAEQQNIFPQGPCSYFNRK